MTLRGITTGANAAAGNIGERFFDQRLVGVALPLTSGIPLTVVGPRLLTPGDYDVFGQVEFHGAASATTVFAQAISTVTNTLPGFDLLGVSLVLTPALNYTGYSLPPVMRPLSVAVATNIFLVAATVMGGGAGSVTASGWLYARRSANAG